jgi:hypothetical protein
MFVLNLTPLMFLFILSVITVDHLNDFLNGPKRTTVSDREIVLLELQQKYMALYSCILEVRVVENKGEME